MKKNLDRKWLIILLVLAVLSCSLAIFTYQIRSFEQKDDSIILSEYPNKSIVFYRDDCADCREIFPLLYIHNFLNNDLIFVNMNQPFNRQYIQEYDLKSVPTVVKENKKYVGSDIRKLLHCFK
ncbi:thioredoxin [Enterococcus faecium]|nr:thioredoxin [Enterococcus faecium]